MAAGRTRRAPGGVAGKYRRGRRAELLGRRRTVRCHRRARGGALRRADGFQRLHSRSASRRQEGRAVGDGAAAQALDGAGGLSAADRRGVDPRRLHSRHAYDRFRRSGGDDCADAHRARSIRLRARRTDGRAMGRRQTRLVHYAGRTGVDIMRTPFTGVGTAFVTPVTKGGKLDEAAVRRLGRRQIDAGVHFLAPCGTTGENPTLSDAERLRIVEILVDEAGGKTPILAGAGGDNTDEGVHLAGGLQKRGAPGVLSVTPDYNKPTQEGLYQHYKALAESTRLPIIVYNVPGRTGVNVEVSTLVRLSGLPNIAGVKEASGNVTQMCEICRAVPDDFIVLSGDDALTLPLMSVGGRGIISVASNEIPAEMSRLVETAERGDLAAARALHQQLLPLMLVNFSD